MTDSRMKHKKDGSAAWPVSHSVRIFRRGEFPGRGKILAAVSGGSDSLALLLLLREHLQERGESGRLVAATVSHGLRAEAEAEAASVAALCARLGIAHRILPLPQALGAGGVQAAARAARYAALAQEAERCGADVICTGHTLDDQAETYLMRRARLGGAEDNAGAFAAVRRRGLAAMARESLLLGRFHLLRPLLGVERADLRAFLRGQNIGWAEDASNADTAYERARLRQSLGDVEKRQAFANAAQAGMRRQCLAADAAMWGARLRLRRTEEGPELDLTPLRSVEGSLRAGDAAALYLLLAMAAAVCAGKPHIAADDARLRAFVAALPELQKGAPPLRISISGAVAEKRGARLTLRRERRAGAQDAAAERAGGGWPLSFICPGFDAPLFLLFQPLASG